MRKLLGAFLNAWPVVVAAALATPQPSQAQPAACNPTNLGVAANTNGTLGAGDCRIDDLFNDGDTTFVDVYQVILPSDGFLTVSMGSAQIDTYLWLTDATGETVIATDDDDGPGSDSFLDALGLPAGPYWILANSFDLDSGSYALSTAFDPETGQCDPLGEIGTNEVVNSVLTPGDCSPFLLGFAPYDVSRADVYEVTLPAPGFLTVSLESVDGDFNPYLWLLDQGLTQVIAADDNGGPGLTDALLDMIPLDAGTYAIVANGIDEDDVGAYRLTTVPEPGALGLGAAAVATLVGCARRRR